ncbi:MAG: metalloregulator ArsR/SmtB family transcription factor [Spirochaetota bacterium]|nr:metalloregulator ArsR/SmtB family transcription factor [Spirochaetota bacterium]
MEKCLVKCIHQDKVDYTLKYIPHPDIISRVADIFKVISDPSRLKIVMSLIHGELCVCDLSAVSGISESAVSHQLRSLRNLRIVRNRRKGKVVYYRLDNDHIKNLIIQSLEHVIEGSVTSN